MTIPSKFLAAALIVSCAPWAAAPATAAPMSEALALKNAAPEAVETVQYRRYRYRGWAGPFVGGYYAYGYAAPRYRGYGVPPYRGYGSRGYWFCTPDTEANSAYPGWMCPSR